MSALLYHTPLAKQNLAVFGLNTCLAVSPNPSRSSCHAVQNVLGKAHARNQELKQAYQREMYRVSTSTPWWSAGLPVRTALQGLADMLARSLSCLPALILVGAPGQCCLHALHCVRRARSESRLQACVAYAQPYPLNLILHQDYHCARKQMQSTGFPTSADQVTQTRIKPILAGDMSSMATGSCTGRR